jgi:putative ABC transport system permease protein
MPLAFAAGSQDKPVTSNQPFMGFGEAFRMALDALRANKTRSFLTLVGMIIGVFAIIVSVTAVEVIDVYFKDSMQFLGSSTFNVTRYPQIRVDGGRRDERNRPNLSYEQIERLASMMELPVTVSVIEDFHFGAVRYGPRETEPNLVLLGGDQNFLGNFSYELDQGRFLTEQDVQYARAVAVIGKPLADELFPSETALGKSIRMDGHRYEVVGVLAEKGSFLGFSQDNRIVAPITRLFTLYGSTDRNIGSVSLRVQDPVLLNAAMEEARCRRARRTTSKSPPTTRFRASSTRSQVYCGWAAPASASFHFWPPASAS